MNEKLRRDSLVLGIRHNAWCAQRAPARRKAAYSSARVTEIEFASTISATKNKVRQVRTRMLGQLIGHDLPQVEKSWIVRSFFLLLAERECSLMVLKRQAFLSR